MEEKTETLHDNNTLPAKQAKKGSFSFFKALMLCFFINGILFIIGFAFDLANIYSSIISDIAYLVIVIAIIYKSDKHELRRIFTWRNISLSFFSGIMIMFLGARILYSKLCQIIPLLIPLPDGFWASWYGTPNNFLFIIITFCIFPGLSEELFFRGLVLRRFYSRYSPLKALILSSIIFGIIHVNPWQAITTTFMGFLLGWFYLRYKSIWLCIFLHALSNFFAFFRIFPVVEYYNSTFYTYIIMQPLWVDLIGLILFAFGLAIVLLLSKKTTDGKIAEINS